MSLEKKWLVGYSLPLALISFSLITLKVVAKCLDGPDETRFGFPLAWITAGPTSLSYKIDLPALVLDFSVYLGVWVLLSVVVLRRVRLKWKSHLLLCAGLWLAATVVTGFYGLAISADWYLEGVSFNRRYECSEVINVSSG